MTLRRPNLLMALGVALSVASAAHADQLGIDKGKAAASPCSLAFDTGDGTTVIQQGNKRVVQCTDASACDQDGAKNGSCTFSVNVCTAVEGCTAEPVESIKPAAKAKKLSGLVPPTTPQAAVTAACGTAGTIAIPLKGKNKDKASALGKGKMILKTKIASGKGAAVIFAQCLPCVGEDCGGPIEATCPERESGLPKQVNLTVPTTGGDLDNGFSGNSHNFPVTSQSTLKFCLSNCDATTDSICDAAGSTGEGSLNGPFFGAPLPLLANNVPVCVVNRYAGTSVSTTYDLATGQLGGGTGVNLLSDVYVQTADVNGDNVCPRCTGSGIGQPGTCSAGARQGQSCTVDGTIKVVGSGPSTLPLEQREAYNLSTECPPDGSKLAATLVIDLPLTTGESRKDGSEPCQGQTTDDSCSAGTCTADCSGSIPAKGGINQTCCTSNGNPCFPTAPDSPPGAIIRNGTPAIALPAWPDPTYPKTVAGGRAAAVFCEASTNDPTVDLITGLPGPGALLLPYTTDIVATP